MVQGSNGFEELADLGLAQDDRKLLRLVAGGDDLVEVPSSFEGDIVEEAYCSDRDQYRTGRKLLLLGQVELIDLNSAGPSRSGDFLK